MNVIKGKRTIKMINSEMREYIIYDLIDKYDPILKTPTQPFDFNNPPIDPFMLATSLAETMAKNRGIGLSANQVGIPYSVFCMATNAATSDKKLDILILFNPVIVKLSEETINSEEGCLSYPGLTLNVTRPKDITIQFQGVGGDDRIVGFSGLESRIAQHEMMHLNGKLFTDMVGRVSLKMAEKKRKKVLT